MDFDMAEICGVFFEESFEGLDVMENGLLNLDLGAADLEVINTIFRAAHSIKGGAGMFGFEDVSEFTHGVETILDEMRSGKRDVSKEGVQLMLECVDCIHDMLKSSKENTEFDKTRTLALQERIDAMLKNEALPPNVFVFNTPEDEVVEDSHEESAVWRIVFKPKKSLLQVGGNPLQIFRELQALGELTIESNNAWLPAFDSLNPELCYLSWELRLNGLTDRGSIRKIFKEIEDHCQLEIEAQDSDSNIAAAIEGHEDDEIGEGMVFVDALAMQLANAQQSESDEQGKKTVDKVVAMLPAGQKIPPVMTNKPKATTATESIRVGTDKIDQMINLVSELVITQSMLSRFSNGVDNTQLEDLRKGLSQLMRNTRDLQESVMQIRMLPVSVAFNRFPRLVHDISEQLGKKVELKLSGEGTELDKTVLEKIGDPLVHLVRNSLDHGLETPDERRKNGKPETGTLELNAYHAGGSIILEVKDDGAGLNKQKILKKARERGLLGETEEPSDDQIYNLIFQAGFSTADQVNNLSGRGVGMDVVKRNIEDLGGHVSMKSEQGKGSQLTIRLPLTLAILDGQLIRVGNQCYIIPLVAIVESILIQPNRLNALAGKAELYKLREEYIPIIRLYEVFGLKPDTDDINKGLLVVVEVGDQRIGMLVDELLEQQQVVIKSLEANYKQVQGVSGATILGNGEVALILDMPGLAQWFNEHERMKAMRDVA